MAIREKCKKSSRNSQEKCIFISFFTLKKMMDFKIIVWLLPIVFMIHDFEEIIFFKSWIARNKDYLWDKFPKLSKRLFVRLENFSVPAFSLAVAEEFVLLSIVTVLSVVYESYLLWFGIFMGFFIHLLVHLIQWIALRRYIPAIYTSIAALFYCIFSLNYILKNKLFETNEIFVWTFIGFGFMMINLIIAHKLAELFDKKR